MTENYKEALREYGLSENEVQTYVTLLKIGESSVQSIARNSSLPRTTTYHLLASLKEKGLVGSIEKGAITYFQAANPKRLVELLVEKKKLIESVLPDLGKITSTITDKPNVVIFEGSKGIRTILQDVLEEKKEILHYGDLISLTNALPYIFPQFITTRVERRIPIRIMGKQEESHAELIKTAKKENRAFVFIPNTFTFKTSIFLYKSKTAILSIQSEPYYGIVVENKDFYDTQKNMFELLWQAYQK